MAKILNNAQSSEMPYGTEHEAREMSIGIKVMQFQKFHLLLLLFQDYEAYNLRKLETARSIIFILSDLVSNSSQVYNGIVW